ncbi:MAG: hypothetical protein KQI35_17245 [Bacteroidetes bacterium]|nr:hypothetical protein [Bacteroidota bacterium]
MKVKIGMAKQKGKTTCVGGMVDIQGRIVFVFFAFQGWPFTFILLHMNVNSFEKRTEAGIKLCRNGMKLDRWIWSEVNGYCGV